MADIKISALPTATTPLTGAELVPVVQGGVTKQTTATAIFTTGILPVANGGTATATPALVAGTNVTITGTWPNQTINSTASGGGSGTVTNVSVVSTNGLSGTVANATTTPAITLSTSVVGVVKGNGTTLSAATAGTDYVAPGGALGTPSSGTLTNASGLSLTTGVVGVLPIANGGTNGTATPTAGSVAVGTGTAVDYTLVGTAGQVLTSAGSGTPYWSAGGGGGGGSGTVTSVAALTLGTTGTDLSSTVANSTTTPVITLNVPTASATNRGVMSASDWSALLGSKTANNIYAAPNGSAGAPTFRAMVAADVPTLNQNTTGTAANVTGTVAAANGGTGQTVYAVGDIVYASTTTALSKLSDVVTGNALISGGVNVAPSYGKIGLTTHVTGTLPAANGGTGITSLGTGVPAALGVSVGSTGSVILNGGTLGTPSSGTVTNLTGTASININGTVGATTPAAGSFTSLSYSTTLTGGTGIVNLGSGQFYKDASGNVGIGTASPSGGGGGTTLNVFGTSAASLRVNNSADALDFFVTGNIGYLQTTTNIPMVFRTNSIERVRIDGSGVASVNNILTIPTATRTNIGWNTNQIFNVQGTVNNTTLTSGALMNPYLAPLTQIVQVVGASEVNSPTALYSSIETNYPKTTIAATSTVNGQIYTISTVGTTNFVAIGAASNTVGVIFVATGAGSGTGTVTRTVGEILVGLSVRAKTATPSGTSSERQRDAWGINVSVSQEGTTAALPAGDVCGIEVDMVNLTNDSPTSYLAAGHTYGYWAQADSAFGKRNGTAYLATAVGAAGSGWVNGIYIDADVNSYLGYFKTSNVTSNGLYVQVPTASTGYPLVVQNSSATNLLVLDAAGTLTVGGSVNAASLGTAGTVYAKTSTASGATATQAFSMGTLASSINIHYGTGAPTHSSAQGSLYIRTDGSSTTTRLYINTNGTTGWTYLTAGA